MKRALFLAYFLGACASSNEGSADGVYVTNDHSSALYISGNKYVYSPEFQPSDQIDAFVRESGEPITVDGSGCRHLGKLVIPSSSTKRRCDGVRFDRIKKGTADFMEGTCLEDLSPCLRFRLDGDKIASFIFFPNMSESQEYVLSSGIALTLPRSSRFREHNTKCVARNCLRAIPSRRPQ